MPSNPEPDQPVPVPHLRVVKGDPSDADLVALLVAISGVTAAPAASEPAAPPSAWTTYDRGRDRELRPGPDAWRRSLR